MEKIEVTYDPTAHYPNVKHDRLLEVCGIVPHWVVEALILKRENPELSVQEFVGKVYGFPCDPMRGWRMGAQGVLSYDGDPDQHPLLRISCGEDTVYQYEHAWVNFVVGEGEAHTFSVVRMD